MRETQLHFTPLELDPFPETEPYLRCYCVHKNAVNHAGYIGINSRMLCELEMMGCKLSRPTPVICLKK